MLRQHLLLTITVAVLLGSSFSQAQDQKDGVTSTIESARADMRADRTKIITVSMNFSEKEGAAFWPIYRKYEYERSMLDDRRAAVIKDYAMKYSALNDRDAKAMADRMFNCESALVALKKKYFRRFNTELPTLTVTKFFQLEHRIDLVMDMKVESSLPPLFGSLEPTSQAAPQINQAGVNDDQR